MPPPPQTETRRSLNLIELCEPLFQYVCMLNRIARNPGGESMDFGALRKQIEQMLEEMGQIAGSDSRLKAQFEKVRMPLIFFVDSMIAESKLGLAQQWNKNRM